MRPARKIIIAAGVIGGLFVGANVLAERVLESQLSKEAKKAFSTTTAPKVSVDGFPILINILKGRIPRASLVGSNVTAQDLKVAELRLSLEGITASIGDITAGKPIGIDQGLAEADVTAAAVNGYIKSRGERVTLSIKPGKVVVSGTVRGQRASAEGVPRVVGRLLTFTPASATVNGRPVSGAVLQAARRELSFEIDLPLLPGGIRISAIELQDGFATLVAHLEDATINLATVSP